MTKKKKRQRLKEYINYKLNKYYTVIFTLIIWDFLSFLIYLLIYFFINLPYVVDPNTDHFCSPHCPPATAGPISQVNTNSGQEPIVSSHYIHNVLCTQKEKLLYCIVVTVLVIREVWKMILKPSRRCDTWGSCYFPSPPPANGWGTTGSPAPARRHSELRSNPEPGESSHRLLGATFQELSRCLHVTFHYTTAAFHEC